MLLDVSSILCSSVVQILSRKVGHNLIVMVFSLLTIESSLEFKVGILLQRFM